jgi:type I restriction enzyme S subunit
VAKVGKSSVVPRLRFPEFRGAPLWTEARLDDLITVIAPPAKLPSTSYLSFGRFPIIDQSQEFVSGWTEDSSAVIAESLPLIVFGDHTCALKFVSQPFVQGADGIKILKAEPPILIDYLFHALSHQPLEMEDYKRHFSILKERKVFFPGIESGEQQKVADCLTSLDKVIAAQGQKVEALMTYTPTASGQT